MEKIKGGSIEDTHLVSGIVLDKERVSVDMPIVIKNARIALLRMRKILPKNVFFLFWRRD